MRARQVEELSKCTFQPDLVSTQSYSRHRTVHTAGSPPGSPTWSNRLRMHGEGREANEGTFMAG